ncbi:CG31897, partial [Drosophila busckii]
IGNFQALHRQFFYAQLEKLCSTNRYINIKRLHKIIMSTLVPIKNSDFNILDEYDRDPHHYNVHLLALNHLMFQNDALSLLHVIESNYDQIKRSLARVSRHKRIFEKYPRLAHGSKGQGKGEDACSVDMHDVIFSLEHPDIYVINEEYLNRQREKWIKLFAEQKKTPTELKLEEQRRVKYLSQAAQRLTEHRRKNSTVHKKIRKKRSLTELYTAPRSTHRVRKALRSIACNNRGSKLSTKSI